MCTILVDVRTASTLIELEQYIDYFKMEIDYFKMEIDYFKMEIDYF